MNSLPKPTRMMIHDWYEWCGIFTHHRGIENSVKARPGPNQWTWTIQLPGGATKRGEITGPRATAEEKAIRPSPSGCEAVVLQKTVRRS